MLIVFITRDISRNDINKVIKAYKNTFAGPPWFETWEDTQVNNLILEAFEKEKFIGKLILNPNDLCLGFAFGYQVPKYNSQTVNFEKITQNLENLGWNNSFYLAECGVIQNSQNQGLGSLLISDLANSTDNLVFRTTNSNMIKTIENQFGKVESLFYDPIETNRQWYGVRKK